MFLHQDIDKTQSMLQRVRNLKELSEIVTVRIMEEVNHMNNYNLIKKKDFQKFNKIYSHIHSLHWIFEKLQTILAI